MNYSLSFTKGFPVFLSSWCSNSILERVHRAQLNQCNWEQPKKLYGGNHPDCNFMLSLPSCKLHRRMQEDTQSKQSKPSPLNFNVAIRQKPSKRLGTTQFYGSEDRQMHSMLLQFDMTHFSDCCGHEDKKKKGGTNAPCKAFFSSVIVTLILSFGFIFDFVLLQNELKLHANPSKVCNP